MRRAATERRVGRTLPKEPIMSASPHVPGHPHQRPHSPSMSVADWAEDVAVGLALLTAVVVIAGILALLIII